MKNFLFNILFFMCLFCGEAQSYFRNELNVYKSDYSTNRDNINKELIIKDTYVMVGGSILGAGLLYLMPESVTHWNKDDSSSIFSKWRRNVKKGPVQDDDDWFLNWITHPYWGAAYYTAGRSAGLSVFDSFGVSIILSTFFWEYGIEAFAEVPSKQDLIITPVIGSIFGEGFYLAKRHIVNNDDKLLNSKFFGGLAMFLIDPITTVSNIFTKNKNIDEKKITVYSFPTIDGGHIGYTFALNIRF